MHKIFVLVSFLTMLYGCSFTNNMIGLRVSLDEVASESCIVDIIKSTEGVADFKMVGKKYSFVASRYDVEFTPFWQEGLVSEYEILIDGMFLLESTDSFFKNSSKLQKSIHKSIEEGCY